MRIALPVLVLMIAVLGCSRFSSTGAGANNSAASNTASAAKSGKVVDMPALVGKSPEQIKTIIGETPRFETPYLSFDLPQGSLTVDYMKNVQTTIGFESSGPGLDSPDKLGDLVGIDLHGLPAPTPTDGIYFYREVKAGSKTLSTVSLRSTDGKFKQISIDLNL